MIKLRNSSFFCCILRLVLFFAFLLLVAQDVIADRRTRRSPKISLKLTYPVGRSPKVFDAGWVFGASCIVAPGTKNEKDISNRVRWRGTGKFNPKKGSLSRPIFKKIGKNSIILIASFKGKTVRKRYKIRTVRSSKYAHVGTIAYCQSDSHGCLSCPHVVQGPVTSGSSLVTVDGLPAARKGDPGVHCCCCGPNTFVIAEGDPKVLIDGKPAARIGDKTQHCGGVGALGISVASPVPKNTATPVPSKQYYVFGVNAGPNLYIGTKEAISQRSKCSFLNGGLDCDTKVTATQLSGSYDNLSSAQAALCSLVKKKIWWNMYAPCQKRYEMNSGDYYWGCESSVQDAFAAHCPEFKQ